MRRLFAILLVTAGLAILAIVFVVPTVQEHQQQSANDAFLKRVGTPTTLLPVVPITTPEPTGTPTAETIDADLPSPTPDRQIIAAIAPTATPTPSPSPTTGTTDALTAVPTATPVPKVVMPKPTHVTIPSIKVDSDIVEVGLSPIVVDGIDALQWDVPAYKVGHNFSSASPGEGENVVLSGHDDYLGEVFKNLYTLKRGDKIQVQAGDKIWSYTVDQVLLLPETGQPLEKRIANAAFLGTTGDERLTLISCWPYAVDSHRVFVIAKPDWCSNCYHG